MKTVRSHNRHRGVALVMVMIAVAVAMVLTLPFVAAQATNRGISSNVQRHVKARRIAESGIHMAIAQIESNNDWRNAFTDGVWVPDAPFADGTFTVSGEDATGDGDLADNVADAVTLTAVGRVDGVTYKLEATVKPVRRMVFVVDNPATLSTEDQAKLALFQGWGWRVTLLRANEPQANYDAAVLAGEVVYISASASPADINTKLRNAPIGIVSEQADLADDFGLTNANASSDTGYSFDVTAGQHAILASFSNVVSFAGGLPTVHHYEGQLADGVTVLGTDGPGGAAVMIAIDAGATDFGSQFVIEGGSVVPQVDFAASVKVLGAAITSGSQSVPVTLKVQIGNAEYEPFGSYNASASGNVNDDANPRSHVFPETFEAGDAITIAGQSWISGGTYIAVDSDMDSPLVLTLRDGDSVPDIEGYQDQANVESFIQDYIDTDTQTVTLAENQAIYLFELGTTDLSSAAADFQDLVVVVTLANSASELAGSAAGRRVFLPFGRDQFSPEDLTTDGQTLLHQTVEWAAHGRFAGYTTQWDNQP